MNDRLVTSIAKICRSGLEPDALRARVLPRLRRAVPVDALWWAIADPTTLLFTQARREEIPAHTGPYFVDNEFLRDDVNKWTELAHDRAGVRTLMQATGGKPATSARYRDVFEPLGLEDEMRVVLRARGVTWGFMCLHRAAGAAFSRDEAAFVRRIAPHLADGIRRGLVQQTECSHTDRGPGVILIAPDGSLVSASPAARAWLDELSGPTADGIPLELHALAERARDTGASSVHVRTDAGRWVVIDATAMIGEGPQIVAVMIRQAAPDEAAPIIMRAYGLTERERMICGLVFRGFPTRAISDRLKIAEYTVQDHLKAIFDKTGVRSRGELAATVLRRRHQ